jgi:glutamate-1-semialdehyde 2,1-aminomutase
MEVSLLREGEDDGSMTTSDQAATAAPIDRDRIAELTARESAAVDQRTQGSKEMFERANRTLSGGVASSYQVREPWPIYLERGEGAKAWDVDGNELYDFHNGFGSMVQGHANPAIGRAIADRYRKGTHFAAPTEDGIVVAEELAKRFRLPAGATPTPARSRRWTRSGLPAG